MNSTPLLSICIPTHNRAECLCELLESIAGQIQDGVEVVISDDACTDHTSQVVESFRHRLPHLTYFRAETPLRYDRNILKIVELARGDFCWLFGDDDRMEPAALAKVIQTLKHDATLTGLTVGRISYDSRLQECIPVRPLQQTETKMFTQAEEAFLKLLDRLGFLSCQIVNRGIWNRIASAEPLDAYFTGYVQLYLITRMLVTAPRWMFLADECVGFRSDNDSFRVLGLYGRLQMDVCGYATIVGDVFGRSSHVYRRAMSEVARTHARHHIVTAKRAGAPYSYFFRALLLCVRYYWRYPSFWICTFPLLLMPTRLLLRLRRDYQARRFEGIVRNIS